MVWACDVMRREGHYVGRRAMVMKVQGRRKKGSPKRILLDKVKDDKIIKEKGLSADDVYDRATWRRISSYIDPTSNGNKTKEKKKRRKSLSCDNT